MVKKVILYAFLFLGIILIGGGIWLLIAPPSNSNTNLKVNNSGTTTSDASTTSIRTEFERLVNTLENNEKDTYAGCWVDGGRYVIAFTRDGLETVNKYVTANSTLLNYIDLRTFKYSYQTLQQIRNNVDGTLKNLDLFSSCSVNIKENRVDVDVTDSEFFYNTMNQANVQLPEEVKVNIVYEPLREIPFTINPVTGVYFPQLKMHSWIVMNALGYGKLVLKNGYLYIGDVIIIWQPDYFLNNNNGTIEVLNRDGKVVARVGANISMGGGGFSVSLEDINRMIKQPLPLDCPGPFWQQGGDPQIK